MNEYYLFGHKSGDNMRKFYTILTFMNREDELRRLVKWAHRNGHINPLQLYKNRLVDTEKWLFRAQIDALYVVRFAHATLILKKVLFPQPKYYRKGSAKAYKRILLTP